MNKFIQIGQWLLVSVLLSACTTVQKIESVARVSPWKTVPSNPAVTEASRIPASTALPNAPRTEYFGVSIETPPLDQTSQTVKKEDPEESYELNFHDADIRGVIDAVLGEMLELDYVIAPAVNGRITFRTSQPVAKSSLLPALEAALLSVAAAIVKNDQTVHVIPMAEAPQRMRGAQSVMHMSSPTPGFAVEILPLRYIGANDIKTILDSFVPSGTILQADSNHRHLVIAGSSQDRAAVIRTVEKFDVDWLLGMSFAIYRLKQRRPGSIVAELREIFQGSEDLFSNRVRLVSLDSVQSVLGMARGKADLELMSQWIARLDVSQAGDQKIFVYNVQNGDAKNLVSALRQVLTGESTQSKKSGDYSVGSNDQTSEGAQPDTTNIARLVAIEENNSLLFYGTDEEYQVIQGALEQIDVLPRQVMIEAILAEVTLNDNLRYGVQWFFDSGENAVTLSATEGSISSKFPGFSYVYSGTSDARVILNALQSQTEVRILSAPKLSVLNNQTASLQVGDQVPVVVQTSQSTDSGGAPLVSTIQMRDTGVILEVTPRINDNGNVILDVLQEVSEVAKTTTSGIDSPTIQQRKIHTVVATRDGFTVALGGLIRENGGSGQSGIPVLKDIPVLGNLFESSTKDTRRTELVVLLVPHVMRNQLETQSVVDSLVDGLEAASRLAEHARPLAPVK